MMLHTYILMYCPVSPSFIINLPVQFHSVVDPSYMKVYLAVHCVIYMGGSMANIPHLTTITQTLYSHTEFSVCFSYFRGVYIGSV